jgi:phosphonate transport system permease protein
MRERPPRPAPPRLAPPRLAPLSPLAWLGVVVVLALAIASLRGTGVSPALFIEGLPRMARILSEMIPPDPARLPQVLRSLAETFQMAFAGTLIGALLALPLSVLAARTLAPHRLVRFAVRALIAVCRVVPDLVWALLFVAVVGLGPFAGTLALTVDKVGFLGKFFAEAMEEVEPGPQEALRALGAGPAALVAGAVLPAALPSMVNATLYGLERATRSSVILGLVGAGGIGIELQVAMDLFNYAEAATIIIAIFVLVIAVEQASGAIRARLI